VDNQIKIRGFRIEPGEIEAVLGEHPQVRESLVLARDERAEKRLVAYVTVDAEVTAAQLRQYLESKLPPYMIPAAFVLLDRFPASPNGKLDRRALPTPDMGSAAHEYVAPQTPTETELCRIWSHVLSVERVGVQDNFFALGGHSLLAARLVARIRGELQVDLPLRSLFEHPTVRGLAPMVDLALSTGATPDVAEVDLRSEVVLPAEITVAAGGEFPDEPKHVLLTGASGFLGAYLLHTLLTETEADVYCLVRAGSVAEGVDRLRQSLEKYDLWDELHASRIVPVLGDLAAPRLGLGQEHFEQLAQTIDVIYHNGAWVNSMYPYRMLKPANVTGTEEVLRLAAQSRVKPVHYVSTLAVFPPSQWTNGTIEEQFSLDDPAGLAGGYPQSKWVAEQLVVLASRRGIPAAIYRPGRITGDSRSGATSETLKSDDLNLVLQQGRIPRIDAPTPLDMTPVDYVARAIVALSRRPASLGLAFHLANPQPGTWRDVLDAFRRVGYQLEEIDPRRWAADAFQVIQRTPSHALHALLPLAPPEVLQMLEQWKDLPEEDALTDPAAVPIPTRSTIECNNTLDGLAGSGITCPSAAELLDVYLSYYLRSGQLEPPVAPSTREG
jgi:thioester reductase-like protein